MNCPRCGQSNPDDAAICSSCSIELQNDNARALAAERSRRRLARMVRLVTILAVVGLFAVRYFSIFVHISAGLIVLAWYGVNLTRSHRARQRGETWGPSLRGEVVVLLIVGLHFLAARLYSMDAPPIRDDYSIAHFSDPGPDHDQAWALVLALSDPNLLGDSQSDARDVLYDEISEVEDGIEDPNIPTVPDVLPYEPQIRGILATVQPARGIAAELARCPAIPDHRLPQSISANIDEPLPIVDPCKVLLRSNKLHTYLLAGLGRWEEAVDTLVEVDLVFREFSIHARCLLTKLCSIAVINGDVIVAAHLVNDPRLPASELLRLRRHFSALTDEQMSLTNPILWEYLSFRETVTGEILSDVISTVGAEWSPGQLIKPNSASRMYRNLCNRWLDRDCNPPDRSLPQRAQLKVWPIVYPNFPAAFDQEYRVPVSYKFYNLMGSALLELLVPALEKVLEINTKVRIADDLLQVLFALRLGEPYSLEARAWSEAYVINRERKIIYSPGPDGAAFTKDDVSLPFNPDLFPEPQPTAEAQ